MTGAGGFIGGRVVESLYFHPEYDPRAGIHTWKGSPRITRFPIEVVRTDIMDPASLARAMEGVDAVVHCAVGSPDVTIEGTHNALKLALEKGVRRFVHLSTVEVYGNASGEIGELQPFGYTGNSYGDSKIEAEKLVWQFHEKGLPVVVLRPSIVYGPFSTYWTMRLVERIASGRWGILEGYGEGTCNLVYIDDVVRLIFAALHDERAVGEAFNANGPDALSWNDYFQLLAATLGRPPLKTIGRSGSRITSLVMDPIKAVARFMLAHYGDQVMSVYERYGWAKAIIKRAERSMKSTPGADELQLYMRKMRFSMDKARDCLGFEPNFTADSGVELTTRWIKHHGVTDMYP